MFSSVKFSCNNIGRAFCAGLTSINYYNIMDGSKKPPGRYYSYHRLITIISRIQKSLRIQIELTPIYSCIITYFLHTQMPFLTNNLAQANKHFNKQAIPHSLVCYPVNLGWALVSCDNRDTMWVLGYNLLISIDCHIYAYE